MSVPCQKIDPAQWPRSESFAFFSSLDQPFYSVCFRVDVTALHAYTKANGLSFYHSMVWLVTQAVNETENLRYTLRGGRLCRQQSGGNVQPAVHLRPVRPRQDASAVCHRQRRA